MPLSVACVASKVCQLCDCADRLTHARYASLQPEYSCCFEFVIDPGGVLPMWWVIHMCRGFDPLFSLWQDRARSFWGIFSHPPTPKRSFGVLKLPILTEFDLLGPKFHFSLDLFGSNFQRPAAHPHHFSDRVPPPGLSMLSGEIYLRLKPYLVVKISSDIVTEHCCQVCVLSMMFCRSDCRLCADMVSDCAIWKLLGEPCGPPGQRQNILHIWFSHFTLMTETHRG